MTTTLTESSAWVTVDVYDATDPFSSAVVIGPVQQLVNRTKYLYDALGGGGAPTNASYLVLGGSGLLTDERVFALGTGLGFVDGGAGGAYTVSLANTTVSAGAYTCANITVDAQGRITAAASADADDLPLATSPSGSLAGATTVDDAMVIVDGLSLSTSLLVAKTVFVDGTNGSAAGTRGDAADPFATIAQGLAAMQTGDTLLVRAGTYSHTAVIELPDLADIRIVHEPGVVVTSTANRTYRRASVTAMNNLLIEGGTIANTHATGITIVIAGNNVPTTPGYGTGTGEIVLRHCLITQSNDYRSLGITCVGNLFVEDVRVNSGSDLAQVGRATLRNFDADRAHALTADFDTATTLPDGFAGPGELHLYSAKLGSLTLDGSLTATTDASCELGDVETTRSAGTLTMVDGMTGDLTVADTGTASSTFTGTLIDGDVTDTAGATYTDVNVSGTVDVIGVEASFNGGSVVGAVVASGGGGITIDGTILAVPATGTGGEILDKRETNGWIALTAGTDYTATPASALTLTMDVDYVGTIRPGMAVRWVSSVGVLTNNTWVA